VKKLVFSSSAETSRMPLMDLFDHRRHLPRVATAGSHLNPHDDLRGRIGAELDVVGRAETAIGHLHDGGLGVGRRDPGFLLGVGLLLQTS
jgi:hypothetical protein